MTGQQQTTPAASDKLWCCAEQTGNAIEANLLHEGHDYEENTMATKPRLMDRIKTLLADFIGGADVTSDGHPARVPEKKSGSGVVSPLASAGVGRLRFGNQGGGFGAEHTRSNLG